MSKTATPPKTKQQNPQTLGELIEISLAQHEGLVESLRKKRELESQLAVLQSEFDQTNAECNRPATELADRVLSGDDLSDRQEIFAKRDSLKQRVEAFKAAIHKHKETVSKNRCEAVTIAMESSIRPEYEQRFSDFVSGISAFVNSLERFVELRDTLSNAQMGASWAVFFDTENMRMLANSIKQSLSKYQQQS